MKKKRQKKGFFFENFFPPKLELMLPKKKKKMHLPESFTNIYREKMNPLLHKVKKKSYILLDTLYRKKYEWKLLGPLRVSISHTSYRPPAPSHSSSTRAGSVAYSSQTYPCL